MREIGAEEWYERLEDPHPVLVVISGPSGVGKDAVLQRMQEMGYPFHFVITATTRERRPTEEDGADYFFLTDAEFERMLEDGELLEHAMVYGQHKGVPKAQVREALASGKDVLMRVDVQGAATIRQLVSQAISIFLSAPSEEELVDRLRRRRTESACNLRHRIEVAREEMERIPEFDYLVVNRDGLLDETVLRIVAIMEAEKSCVQWRKVEL